MDDSFDKANNIRKPEAAVTDVNLKGVSRDGVTYAAKVSVDNPYPHSIPICGISYTLKTANRVIASGTIPDSGFPAPLTGKEKALLDVPVKVPGSVLESLVGADADGDIDYVLEIGLTVDLPDNIGNFTIPLSTTGEIKLPTLSELWKNHQISGRKNEE